MQSQQQIPQQQNQKVFQHCKCIQKVIAIKKVSKNSTLVWGIIALFSVLLLDLLNLSIQYDEFDQRILLIYIVKLSLLVGFLIFWFSVKYKQMKKKYQKGMFFVCNISLPITIIEEMLIKHEYIDQSNIFVIGTLQISIVVVIFWQIINQNKISMASQIIITCYIVGRFFNYINVSIQQIVFFVSQFLILACFSINRFYFEICINELKIQECHLTIDENNQQQIQQNQTKYNNDNSQIQRYQQNEQAYNNFRNGHQHVSSTQINTINKSTQNINNNITQMDHLRDISEIKNKGLSFSFDIAGKELAFSNLYQANTHANLISQPIRSPLNLSLQYDKESESGQRFIYNSQKLQNKNSNYDILQANILQQGLVRCGSQLNESGNFLKASAQNSVSYDSLQLNNNQSDSILQQNKFQLHTQPLGVANNISNLSPSNNLYYENPQILMQKLYGTNNVESQKNINIAQNENINSKKIQKGKSGHSETDNLVNFYNMFFNILPEGIAIIPLLNFPEKFDQCEINQTLKSLLECDNKERCMQILKELRNSKIEESLLSSNSNNMNVSNLNHSALYVGSNIDFISQMRSDSVISAVGGINQSDQTKKRKTDQISVISTKSLKEDMPAQLYDQNLFDQNEENYINEKTRRITFVVDYNIKKPKNLDTQSEIITQNRKYSLNETRNNNFIHKQEQDPKQNNQNSYEQQNFNGIPLLKPSNYQVQVKQLQNLNSFESYEMIGVHVRMVSKSKLDNDKVKYFEIIFIPCIIKSEITVVLVVKDITHFNEIEVLKMVNENKSQMLSQVAHEIRTPLNCVISMIEITKELTEKSICENYLGPALTSARLLNNLIQDLLDMSQVKAGCFQLKSTKFNIRTLLEEVRQLMKIQVQGSNIKMEIQCNDSVPSSVYSDPFRIRQILINLIGNALKFTQKGFITVLVDRHQNIDTILKIAVKDTGIGIKPKQRNKLFKAFGKIDDDNHEILNPKGVGLGLMISNELAKKLSNPVFTNQGLEVASVPGEGSEFSFYIIDNAMQASALHISQKQITLNEQKTEKTGKYRVNSSSLHRIDEEERENKSQNDLLIIENNPSLMRNHQTSIINTLPNSLQQGSYLNYLYSNHNNINTMSMSGSAISSAHYELYPHHQGFPPSTQTNKDIQSFNKSNIQNSQPKSNQRIVNTMNSFDHNIEDEESTAKPIHKQKQHKINYLIQQLNKQMPFVRSLSQDSYSSIHSHSQGNTPTSSRFEIEQVQSQKRNVQSKYFQSAQSLKTINQQQNFTQQQQTNSPTKYSNTSQAKNRPSIKNFLIQQKIDEFERQFGNVVNPLLETREFTTSTFQNEDQSVFTKKEKAQQCACNKILIVDDNNFNIYALQQLIKALKQYECDTALSGEQSISQIQQKMHQSCCQKYKIIFMDIDMPSQSGLQTTQIIRKNYYNLKDTKIIGCSGYSSSQEFQNCIDVGMNDYLAKPIDKIHLKQILENFM